MYHYVYKLTFPDGMQYIGVHSTTIEPHLDTCYLGSGKALPPRDRFSCSKEIIEICASRQEATDLEVALITEHDAVKSPMFYNQRLRTFDKHGTQLTEEHKHKCSIAGKGQSRVEWGRKYSGSGRTPAQVAGAKRAGDKIRGTTNPAKGSPGTKNQGFAPWYYITPSGEYVEVHDRTKQEVAPELGLTYRQLGHGFHYTNEHKKAKTLPRKGWTFGNLPKPTHSGED